MACKKRVLITGGASGIGLACADRFTANGLDVVVVDIDRERLDSLSINVSSKHYLDVTEPKNVDMLVARHEPIDILVNSAGIVGPNVPIWDIADVQWERTLAVNLTGTFNTMRAVLPGMRRRGWGRIINIASIAGKEGNPSLSAYSASKAAVIGLTKAVGKEVAAEGILVNAIAPAVIATSMNADTSPEMMEYMISRIPMGRMGEAQEVASLVAWMVSDECSFSTAQVYDISGGRATY